MLAYYSVAASRDFWDEHWGRHSVEELLAIARRSPLTRLITEALPSEGAILEGGCGLGPYVLLLRERGWRVAGVDTSLEALAACRRAAPAPLALMDLRALAIADGALAGYISLGVVEHDPAGPDAILAEAHRALAPGGVLIVSVPYVNGVRRLGSPWIRRRNRAIARQGGAFYQSAFSRAELAAALTRCGFTVRAAHPYDPARIVRQALRWLLPRVRRARPSARGGAPSAEVTHRAPASDRLTGPDRPPTPNRVPTPDRVPAPRVPALAALARRLLYTEPALRLVGHMLLVVAEKG